MSRSRCSSWPVSASVASSNPPHAASSRQPESIESSARRHRLRTFPDQHEEIAAALSLRRRGRERPGSAGRVWLSGRHRPVPLATADKQLRARRERSSGYRPFAADDVIDRQIDRYIADTESELFGRLILEVMSFINVIKMSSRARAHSAGGIREYRAWSTINNVRRPASRRARYRKQYR